MTMMKTSSLIRLNYENGRYNASRVNGKQIPKDIVRKFLDYFRLNFEELAIETSIGKSVTIQGSRGEEFHFQLVDLDPSTRTPTIDFEVESFGKLKKRKVSTTSQTSEIQAYFANLVADMPQQIGLNTLEKECLVSITQLIQKLLVIQRAEFDQLFFTAMLEQMSQVATPQEQHAIQILLLRIQVPSQSKPCSPIGPNENALSNPGGNVFPRLIQKIFGSKS